MYGAKMWPTSPNLWEKWATLILAIHVIPKSKKTTVFAQNDKLQMVFIYLSLI